MQINADSKVADIAVDNPATIRVFQRYGIDFCCGGKVPLAEACEKQGVDADALLRDLRSTQSAGEDSTDWPGGSLAQLTAYIQNRYHEPLRRELPRLAAMFAKVVDRHGARLPDTLLPLRTTYDALHRDLMDHMAREDAVLFPLIIELEARESDPEVESSAWLPQIVSRMAAEHDVAGTTLRVMRELSGNYVPPEWACPTFVGLYHGLAELERDMHLHVHLENAILFPRAIGQNVTPMP